LGRGSCIIATSGNRHTISGETFERVGSNDDERH
jgi:hypothetical protein